MINTSPPSGTRDFLSKDVLQRQYAIEVIEKIYRSYGFEPLQTPSYERSATLLGKYGEDGEKLIFRLLHRGDKLKKALKKDDVSQATLSELSLRYDLTIPLARVVANYRHELPRIYKRYQIQPVWRADRPGRGRFREFWQCDVDVAGSSSMLVECEVISAVTDVLTTLGFDQFKIRLNHRKVLTGLLEIADISSEQASSAVVAIDKLDKIGEEGVEKELVKRGIAQQSIDKLMPILATPLEDNASSLDWLATTLSSSEIGMEGVNELRELFNFLKDTDTPNYLRIDPYLARGMSYYTGPIFEIEEPGLSGSLGGGGRYDNLVGMFMKEQIPACGFSIGLERIIVLMQERNMFPEDMAKPQLLLTIKDETLVAETLKLASEMRAAGIVVDVYTNLNESYGKQYKYAEERGIKFAILIDSEKIESGHVDVRDLSSREQITMPRSELLASFKSD